MNDATVKRSLENIAQVASIALDYFSEGKFEDAALNLDEVVDSASDLIKEMELREDAKHER